MRVALRVLITIQVDGHKCQNQGPWPTEVYKLHFGPHYSPASVLYFCGLYKRQLYVRI